MLIHQQNKLADAFPVFHVTQLSKRVTFSLQCMGPSMEPTLKSGEILISEHISSKQKKFVNGDIVIVRSPKNPHMHLCKRIVGTPGDKIKNSKLEWNDNIVPRGHGEF